MISADEITDEMVAAGIAALRDAEKTHQEASLPDGPLGRYVPWIEHAVRSVLAAALATSAPIPEDDPEDNRAASAIRKLRILKRDFAMKGANATTIERVIDFIKSFRPRAGDRRR